MLLLAAGLPCVAEETAASYAKVLQILYPSRTPDNYSHHDIIAESTRIELEHAGFSVLFDPEITIDIEEGSEEAAVSVREGQLNRLGSRLDADFLILTVFSVEGEEARMRFSWYDMAQNRFVASVSKSGRINLSFDRTVAEAIEEIVSLSGANPVPLPAAPPSDSLVIVEPEQPAHPAPRFEFAVGFSPYLVNGSSADYFKVGLMPSVCVDYRIALPKSYLALGLFGAVNLFNAEGNLAISESALIPIGLELRYGYQSDQPLGVFLRFSGGPALLTIDPNQAGRLWKVIPYALAGLGIDLPFTYLLGVKLEAAYAVYFEQKGWIYGFAPSLYLCVRF